jgi:hypothetical protein
MLEQQVRKCLIGEFLKILHAIARQQIKSVPGLIVELDTFAAHQGPLAASFHGRSRHCQSGLPTFRGIVTTPQAGGEQLFDADARAPRPQ